MSVCLSVCYSWSCQSFSQRAGYKSLKMKIRDAILSIEQGMGSEIAAPTDLGGVAYLQVAEARPSDRKIVVVAVHTGLLVGMCAVFL